MIVCPRCKKEQDSTSKKCVYCGCKLQRKESLIDKIKKNKKKTFILIGSFILIFVLCIAAFWLFNGGLIELEELKYINEVKKIDNVNEINAVVAISGKKSEEKDDALNYVVFYSTEYNNYKFAYFQNGEYMGDGYNGGDAKTNEDKTFYNLYSLVAVKDVIEFIENKGLLSTKCKEHYDTYQSVVYVDLVNFDEWIVNK